MALCTTVQQDDSHVIHDYMLVRAVHALRAVRAVGVMGVVCAVGGVLARYCAVLTGSVTGQAPGTSHRDEVPVKCKFTAVSALEHASSDDLGRDCVHMRTRA